MDMAWMKDPIGISVSILALVLAIAWLWFARSPREQENKQEDEEGDIAWILKALNSFQDSFNSLAPARAPLPPNNVKKLNDYIYELCKPSGRPSVEIVFFHGFQLGGSTETFVTTWLSRDGSELWLNWITGPFPEARILLVSYEASATKKSDEVYTDMYITCENLLQSLTAAGVGQDGCPVILVGHSLGGLIIKEILLQANKVLSLGNHPNERVQYFFENVKELFYYSCPHHGTRLADIKTKRRKGPLFKLLTTLNKKGARRNGDFCQLRSKYKWGASSIAERLPVDLGSYGRHVVVTEASARHDTDGGYYTADADHFSVCRPESMSDTSFGMLRDVIDHTVKKDVRGHQIPFPSDFVGLNDQINRVRRKLKTARHLGICGIGGIGKSTLGKAVYNAISGNFEYTSFVSEVKELVRKNVSIKDLQAEILRNLYFKGRKCEDQDQWEGLKGKRVLIILDDVEYESQILVMPETNTGVSFFADESRVLVTSRDKKIVSSKDFEVYNVEFLSDKASRKLFCRHAFENELAPSAYESHVEKFTSKCGGLPLALEVAGKYLYKQGEDVWDDAFTRFSAAKPLRGGKEDDFWSIFEIIYNSLQGEEQEMFLDIATCFHYEKLEEVKRVWGCCDWVTTPNVGLQNLVDIGFVRQEGGFIAPYIWMHEVLRDFGYSKANPGSPGSLCSHSRICYEGITELPTWPPKQGTPQVKILKIESRESIDDLSSIPLVINTESLSGLENLKVLWLQKVELHGAWNLLPNNLQFLRMEGCTWSYKSSESSSLKSWPHPSLRHLELFLPREMKDETFQQLGALKYLLIKSSRHHNEVLPNSLWKLPALEILELDDLSLLKSVPGSDVQLPALKRLTITECPSLENIAESIRQLVALEDLTIGRVSVRALPSTLGELRALQRLEIGDCQSLEDIPDSLGQLQNLRHLRFSGSIWTGVDADALRQERRHVRIPDGVLAGLPNILEQFQFIRQWRISGWPTLVALPNTLGQLRNLGHLDIFNCHNLVALPNTLGQLESLRHLDISDCLNLVALPNTLGELQNLRHLRISSCHKLEAFPNTFGQLQNLRHFILDACGNLKALPESLGSIASLESLQIKGCRQLEALPNTIGQLRGLQRLDIVGCDLQTLPDTLGALQALKHLEIVDCRWLSALPDTLGDLQALEHLEIFDCRSLSALPHTLVNLQALRKFIIEDCDELQALPNGLWNCRTLQHLEVKNCECLQLAPATITQLQAVLHFEIDKQSMSGYVRESVREMDWRSMLGFGSDLEGTDLTDGSVME